MERLDGGLKDIFDTILGETRPGKPSNAAVPKIVVHGNGNVIAPGGTVHVVHAASVPDTPGNARTGTQG